MKCVSKLQKSNILLIGPTGSGKTTTVDIILGLLKAQKGVLEVDNQPINDNNDLESDYTLVNFSLRTKNNNDSNIYIIGNFNNHEISEMQKLHQQIQANAKYAKT